MMTVIMLLSLQDNLTLFQNCCREVFGLQDCQLFDIHDLDDLRLRVIVECVSRF